MQARIHKSMTGEQRLLLALEMSYLSHALMKAGIRSRHPDWSEEQVTREFRRCLFGQGPSQSWWYGLWCEQAASKLARHLLLWPIRVPASDTRFHQPMRQR